MRRLKTSQYQIIGHLEHNIKQNSLIAEQLFLITDIACYLLLNWFHQLDTLGKMDLPVDLL